MLPALPTPLQPAREAAPCDADGFVAPPPSPGQRNVLVGRLAQLVSGSSRSRTAAHGRRPH
jgi:hypothetical protein